MHIPYPFQTKMVKIYTLFQLKTAQKPYPLGPQIATIQDEHNFSTLVKMTEIIPL